MERSPCSVDAGVCLVGARVDFVLVQALALCNVGADRVSRPLTERVAGHAYMASHLACVKGEGGAISMQTR
jgi:hypothetical protein